MILPMHVCLHAERLSIHPSIFLDVICAYTYYKFIKLPVCALIIKANELNELVGKAFKAAFAKNSLKREKKKKSQQPQRTPSPKASPQQPQRTPSPKTSSQQPQRSPSPQPPPYQPSAPSYPTPNLQVPKLLLQAVVGLMSFTPEFGWGLGKSRSL